MLTNIRLVLMMLITTLSVGANKYMLPHAPKMSETVLKNSILQEVSAVSEYGIYIKNLKDNSVLAINADKQMHSASIGKLLVAVCALEKIQNKKLSESVLPDVKVMINKSDNDAWDRLNNTLSFSYLNACAKNYTLPNTWVFDNLSTAKDTGELLTGIINEKLLNTTYKNYLLAYMQNTENERLISRGIPNGITFYHKTGTFERGLHDAAIVEAKTPYILVIFTNDPSGKISWDQRERVLTNISKKVYDFFSY